MKILYTLFISIAISFSLPANMTENPLITLNIKPEFYFNTPFNHQCIEKISGAKIIEAGFVYKSSEMDLEVFSSNHLFLLNGDNINMFGTAWQLFTSPEFLETIRNDFKIISKADAAVFQDLLYLVDQRSSWTSYFQQGNDWFFIRRTFFEESEAWKVSTDNKGAITSIEFNERTNITKPAEVFEVDYPSLDYEQLDEYVLSEQLTKNIQGLINEKIKYAESAVERTSKALSAISNAAIHEFSCSLEEEVHDEENGTYTSSSVQVFLAVALHNEMQFFYSYNDVLESQVFLESLKPSFALKETTDASVFEAMLDDFTNYMQNEKIVLFENNVWNFVRDESFGSKVGFVVETDENGKVTNIAYSNNMDIEMIEEEFDEATADWGFKLILPESNNIEVVEGTPINYAVEFNVKPVTKMGAWIYASLNNENLNMYFGNEIYSPHYGDIRSDELPIGKHILDIYLMRPGNDTETAIDKTSVEINVVPFNDEGVVWDFVMDEPKSNSVKANAGESVPVAFMFNAEEANRLGVRLDIYFEGQLVGGQKAPNLQSPFKMDIPGGELKHGSNKVEFVFAGGSKTLAKYEVNVEVK